jgi:hypothetical protein
MKKISQSLLARFVLTAALALVLVVALLLVEGHAPTAAVAEEKDMNGDTDSISVRVLSEGKPVPGADVYRLVRKHGRLEIDYEVVTECIAKTGYEGIFSLPVKMKNGRMDEGYYLSAEAPGRLIGFNYIDVNTDPDSMIIILYPVSTVSGIVRNHEGRPIQDAEIKVWGIFIGGLRPVPLGPLAGTHSITDGQGRFKLERIPDKSRIGFYINAQGYASQNRSEIQAGKDNLPITLEPEGRITGRVMYETGEPVKGIIIDARPLRGSGQTMNFYNCITDEKGFYALSKLSGGMYTVNIQPDSTFAGWVAAPKENIGTGRGEIREKVDFTLIRGIPVSGRVIEKETGNPVPGVKVFANMSIRSAHTMLHFGSGTKTGIDGRYCIGVIPGEIYVNASPPEGFFEGVGSKKITVSQQKQIEDVDIQIQRGVEVNGTIHLPDGAPASGVIIDNCGMPGQYVSTDKNGRFKFSGILPGHDWKFYAAKPESNLEAFFTVKVAPGVNVDVTLHEPRYTSASGIVVDYNNNPVPGFMIGAMNLEGYY